MMKAKVVGFSLLEVLVALMVIGIGMAAALSLSVKSIETLSEVEKITYANWVADNLIIELKLQQNRSPGVLEGTDSLAGYTWYWKADIKPTSDKDVLQCRMLVSTSEEFVTVIADVTAYLSSTPS